ncbi:MAG: hypothetical protein KJ052_09470 [Candidatus Hydrogenedentes bacterium]|nr:hypothetical protein [Candidatus Hydrogenedentota bacterium]
MAIKGKAYQKTTWTFQERPVASAKLNTWDDRIEAALELAFELLSRAWGGGDGVVRDGSGGELKVEATSPASMTVNVLPGYAFITRMPCKLAAAQSIQVIAPASQPRIDLVQLRLDTWDAAVKEGVESATPAAPTADDADCIVLAHLHLRTGMASVKDSDDGVNGYIEDARRYL